MSGHARSQLPFRGTTEEEIADAIHTADWTAAELSRLQCREDFRFDQEWNGEVYGTKQMRPICLRSAWPLPGLPQGLRQAGWWFSAYA